MMKILIATSDKKAGGIERALIDQLGLLGGNDAYDLSLLSPDSSASAYAKKHLKLSSLRRFAYRTLPAFSALGMKHNYDIALCHNGFMAQGLGRLANYVIGICHNDKPHHFNGCDRLVCLTKEGLAKAQKAGWAAEKLTLIPHFHNAPKGLKIPKPQSPLTIGAAGRMVEKKNLSLFIEIAALVKQTHPDIRFALGGDGPLRERLRALNHHYGNPVEMRGWIDFPAFLKELDVMIVPSKDEPFGFIFPEAMAEGVALIATPTNGASHCLNDGTVGPILPSDKPEAFAKEICALADDLPLLHKRQKTAYDYVGTALFDRDKARQKWDALLSNYKC